MRIEPEITGVLIELTPLERRLLTTLLTQYDELVHDQLDDRDVADDPALARLFPNAYPDDAEAAAEFHRYTRDSLVEHKTANSGLISAALVASSDDDRLTVARDDAEHWLPALTDLRLVLAERLGIRRDDDPLPETELADVYQWLGELQWALIEALD
ncbi:MAG: DUF2017 family protein [Pseudolysinimonas sp.]